MTGVHGDELNRKICGSLVRISLETVGRAARSVCDEVVWLPERDASVAKPSGSPMLRSNEPRSGRKRVCKPRRGRAVDRWVQNCRGGMSQTLLPQAALTFSAYSAPLRLTPARASASRTRASRSGDTR